LTAHFNGVAIALTTRFSCGGLPDINYTVNQILLAVLPNQYSWEHHAVGVEIGDDLHIYFRIHNYKPSSAGIIVLFSCSQGKSQPVFIRCWL
jgi:hypothetical protein